MVKVILSEKPKAALKIATALSAKFNTKFIKTSEKGVPVYEINTGNEKIKIVSAVGHLFTLKEKQDNNWSYPVFDIEWVESSKVNKNSAFTKKYVDVLRKIAKETDDLYIATDYDIEGEVIGLNIMRFIFNRKDANRMKFSTLTVPDLINAYDNSMNHIDWGQATAGETRHILDWFWGINLSRALTSSIKSTGTFKILSTGRVQGPALKILYDRELEIEHFVPTPFWVLEVKLEKNSEKLNAIFEEEKIYEKEKAENIYIDIKSKKIKEVKIKKIEKTQKKQNPPHPFDLTSLQTEAYSLFKINPKETLAIAQELYTSGYISYPRTSSQQLPAKIGFRKILEGLNKNPEYKEKTSFLLNKEKLIPNNGKKKDPAHPAIYPTGILPKDLKSKEKKIYDLIVKRFFATFGDAATRESRKIIFDVKGYNFIAKGTTTVEKGWHTLYEPYVKLKEEELPLLKENEYVVFKKIDKKEKQTQPPNRYNQASIIKELEKRHLGTKATRATIIDILYQRGYIKGDKIEVSDLGKNIVEILMKYSPKILDENLTAHFEDELESIREGKKKQEEVLEEAKKVLLEILNDFKKKENAIGKELSDSNRKTQNAENTLGKCPKCGGDLIVRYSKKTKKKFVGCSNYPNCNVIYPLPSSGSIKKTNKVCEICHTPIIKVIRRGKKTFEMCLDPNCKTKKDWGNSNNSNSSGSEAKTN